MIPDTIMKDILKYGANNIVSIIGESVELKPAHKRFEACCPFHSEKTPSFSVDPVRKTWRCFGACSEGGDVVNFLMKKDGISFPEALKRIASRAGIVIPNGESKEEKEMKAMQAVLAKAASFYQRCLQENKNGARAYVDSRMTKEMIVSHGIGFSPATGHALLDFLKSERLSLEVAEKAGLIKKEDNGSYRDYFWGRIMFPIRNQQGFMIGFGGRSIKSETSKLKYVNTPETPLYKKTATLFGLDVAIDEIKKTGEAFVVEGYLDRMQMRAAGILNVVATCGTAFTKDHAAFLKRYCRRLNLMFDGDEAGHKALKRSIMLAVKEEMSVTAYLLPDNEDPDSYFKKGGSLAEIQTMTGFEFLKKSGEELTGTMKLLARQETLEKGVLYMVQNIPAVAKLLKRRGKLGELFGPDVLPEVERICASL